MTINSSGALDSHESFDGTASVALNPARDLPFMVASNGAVTIYSADGRTALPAEWTGICVDARDVRRFWHIGRSESERSFTALLATTYDGAASEAESRGLTMAPQWFLYIQPPLWNKIVDTAGLEWNVSMLKHWDEFSDVEQDALNSAADKVMTYRYELRVAGEQFMTGDQSSIGMLFGNLTGRNFDRKKNAGEGHQDWLRYMSMEYSTSLPMGAVVEMLSPAGDLIRQNSIGGLLGVNLVLQAENSEVKVVGDTQKSEIARTRAVEFVSVWDDGEIVTKAILDLQTGEVRDIEVSDNGAEYESLQYEEIRVDGMWAMVTASDDNRYFIEDMALLPQFSFGYGRAERRIVELPDGYNGSVKKFFAEPLERNGATVKLQCAEPGQEYLIAWKAESEVAAALKSGANDVIDMAAMQPGWTNVHDEAAIREGWIIAECHGSENGPRQIQRIDDPDDCVARDGTSVPHLRSDDEAMRIVANGTEAHHIAAREFMRAHNPMEYEAIVHAGRGRTQDRSVPAFEIGQRFNFQPGAKIVGNGFPGTVIRMYSEGMVEVRLPGGIACIPASFPDCYPENAAADALSKDGGASRYTVRRDKTSGMAVLSCPEWKDEVSFGGQPAIRQFAQEQPGIPKRTIDELIAHDCGYTACEMKGIVWRVTNEVTGHWVAGVTEDEAWNAAARYAEWRHQVVTTVKSPNFPGIDDLGDSADEITENVEKFLRENGVEPIRSWNEIANDIEDIEPGLADWLRKAGEHWDEAIERADRCRP